MSEGKRKKQTSEKGENEDIMISNGKFTCIGWKRGAGHKLESNISGIDTEATH